MRKIIIALFLLALVSPIFAQNDPDRLPRVYYINVPIERIIPTVDGYIIQYRSASAVIATIGIPIGWFTDAAGRAHRIQLPAGRSWPTMSVFFSDGEFSHVRIYVHRSRAHQTWGNIPQGTDVSRFFGDGETFDIQF